VVRVYRDLLGRGYEECEVTTIDGEPALSHLQKWSDKSSYSKDAGVRLNQALSTQTFHFTSGQYEIVPGEYTQRDRLPENPTVKYELKCSNISTPVTTEEKWKIFVLTSAFFTDVTTYANNVCKRTPATILKRDLEYTPELPINPKHNKRLYQDAVAPGPSTASPMSILPNADITGNGNVTVFYRLKNRPDVGVIVVSSHLGQGTELQTIVNNYLQFNALNVSKIIIDFQGNPGGYVDFASTFVQLLFPNKGPTDLMYPMDFRVDANVLQLSTLSFNKASSIYNAVQFLNLATGLPYTDNSLFTNQINITRNGRSASYTPLTSAITTAFQPIPELAGLPWTNNPANIRILTDGRCGSACALSSLFLARYNVQSYVIGGIHGKDMSKFSFPGGAVFSMDDIMTMYKSAGATTPLTTLPYKGKARIPLWEIYAPQSQIPFEYDAALYGGGSRLNYDPENARSRDIMWHQVAMDAWK
ncbi:hypothetical protein BGZ76_009961, partial [Entomortierella beljakovae]